MTETAGPASRRRADARRNEKALLDAAAADSGEIGPGVDAYELMRGVGNLCIGADSDPRYDARRLVGLLIAGLRRADPA